MTTKSTARRRALSDKAERGDPEACALAANPRFWELIEEGRRSGPVLTVEESNAKAGITDEEWAAADAEIDRLLAEQATAESTAAPQANSVPAKRRPSKD